MDCHEILAAARCRVGARSMNRVWLFAICGGLGVMTSPAVAITDCVVGQRVIDPFGENGEIVWSGGDFCKVRYADGQSHGWMAHDLQASNAAPKSGLATANGGAHDTAVLRPAPNTLVYRADPQGHFHLTAVVNGAPLRFMIDTGATVVALTLGDAAAAGIDRDTLVFNATVETANGRVPAAYVKLREVRLGELSINDIGAVVQPKLRQSVLGMSFLSRLRRFEIQEGSLTIEK
jgi:clan AA aspartic protease (TIGR02281 family)